MDDWFINYLVLMSDWNNTVAYCRWSLFKRHALKSLVFHEGDRSSPEVAQHLPSKSSIWWWRRLTRILSCHQPRSLCRPEESHHFPKCCFPGSIIVNSIASSTFILKHYNLYVAVDKLSAFVFVFLYLFFHFNFSISRDSVCSPLISLNKIIALYFNFNFKKRTGH